MDWALSAVVRADLPPGVFHSVYVWVDVGVVYCFIEVYGGSGSNDCLTHPQPNQNIPPNHQQKQIAAYNNHAHVVKGMLEYGCVPFLLFPISSVWRLVSCVCVCIFRKPPHPPDAKLPLHRLLTHIHTQ